MAWFLGPRVVAAGHECLGVYSRNKDAAEELAAELHTQILAGPENIAECAPELILLAVPDDALTTLASQLAAAGSVLMHMAGSVSLDALGSAPEHRAVFWPVYSIRKGQFPAHRSIPSLYEGSTERAVVTAAEVARSVTDMYTQASFEQRRWLHLCAVITNNFTNHLLDICERISEAQHLPEAYLKPILQQTIDHFGRVPLSTVQTGPAARADRKTLEGHELMLQGHPAWKAVYEAISASIMGDQVPPDEKMAL